MRGSRRQRGPRTQDEASGAAISSAKSQVVMSLTAQLLRGVLVLCLVMAPVGLVVGGLAWAQAAAEQPSAAPQAAADGEANDQAMAGELARTLVVTWLTATADDHDALSALVEVSSASLAREPVGVSDPAVAGITEVADGVWSVVVAVTVTDASGSTVRRFFQVPVQQVDGAWRVVSLPSPVAAPNYGSSPALGYAHAVDVSGLVGVTVSQFLAAYAAGAGDVSRYVSPRVVLSPISPAPFVSVDVVEVWSEVEVPADQVPADSQRVRIVVEAAGVVTEEQSLPVSYALTLVGRDGRWEVASVDAAPVIGAEPTSGLPTVSSSAASPTTTP